MEPPAETQGSGARRSELSDLSREIAEDTYRVDALVVADAIIEHHRRLSRLQYPDAEPTEDVT